jgi:hypothetical protein
MLWCGLTNLSFIRLLQAVVQLTYGSKIEISGNHPILKQKEEEEEERKRPV